jgi:hypothetical protein
MPRGLQETPTPHSSMRVHSVPLRHDTAHLSSSAPLAVSKKLTLPSSYLTDAARISRCSLVSQAVGREILTTKVRVRSWINSCGALTSFLRAFFGFSLSVTVITIILVNFYSSTNDIISFAC